MTLHATRPEFLSLFPPNAPLQPLITGLTWAEGPTYVPSQGAVVVSDVRQNRTWWYGKGGARVAEDPSHHQNGHCLDAQGRLIACSHGLRALVRQEENGAWTVLADQFEGKKLNSPNDVALHPDGSLWFTDPTYGIDKPEEGYGGTKEQPGNYVYRLGTDGTLSAPIRDRHKPNGLAFTSAEELLLADTGDGATYRYQVTGDSAQLLGEAFRVAPGKTDGLRIDAAGRIWSSAADGVHVLTADGQELGRIQTPETTANLCFGGENGKTLYIAATSVLYGIETEVHGLEFF